MSRGRKPKAPEELYENFNCKLHPKVKRRLKKIAYRLSVTAGKRVSESAILTEDILAKPMPPTPSRSAIRAYQAEQEKRRKYREKYRKPT